MVIGVNVFFRNGNQGSFFVANYRVKMGNGADKKLSKKIFQGKSES